MSLVGTILGLLPSLIGPVKNWIWRPSLEIILQNEEIFDVANEETKRKPSLFVHLVISNQGRGDAHGVNGYVTDVEKMPECKDELTEKRITDKILRFQFEKVKRFRNPVKLKWSHEPVGEGYKPKTVWVDKAGRRSRRLDLCYVYLDEREFHLFTEHGPRGQILQFGPGIYRITVLVPWNTGKRTEKQFIIYWNGDWREFGVTEDSYGNDMDKVIDDRNKVVLNCKSLISEAFNHLPWDSTNMEDRKIQVYRVPETLGTSVDDKPKKLR